MLAAERILLVASCSSSDDALSTVEDKYPSHQLFYREPNTVQIIQLDECAPPTPRKIASYYSSSYYSSECTSSCTSEEEEEEEDCSSYCSSDLPPDDPESSTDNDISVSGSEDAKLPTEMYSTFQRILAWKENFSSDVSSTGLESADVTSRKRKSVSDDHDGDDSMSHTSKRSRSQPPASLIDAEAAMALDSHPCPACDASFATIEGLRHHGLDSSANEACCVAVEYAFES